MTEGLTCCGQPLSVPLGRRASRVSMTTVHGVTFFPLTPPPQACGKRSTELIGVRLMSDQWPGWMTGPHSDPSLLGDSKA